MNEPLRILVVCTYNRTRSVIIGALLGDALSRRGQTASIATAGFEQAGLPATTEAVSALASRGIDVSDHLSERLTSEMVEQAHVIVTADKVHVARICGDRLDIFQRTFTLPELAGVVEGHLQFGSQPLANWLTSVAPERSPASYLNTYVPEVADPTGLSPLAFASAVAEMERLSNELAGALELRGSGTANR